MPTPRQTEKLAAAVGREPRTVRTPGPADALPPEYCESVLSDPLADARPERPGLPVRTLRLSEIRQHILRVSCNRCSRTVEIQKADAIRLAGAQAVWKEVGQKLLDNTHARRVPEGRELATARWGMPSSSKALMDATKKRAEKLQAKGKPVDFKELPRMEPDGGTPTSAT